MINSKQLFGFLAALVLLGVIIFSVNKWGLSSLATITGRVTAVAKPSESTKQVTTPEEFTNDDLYGHGSQSFSALTTQALWENLLAGFQSGTKTQIGLENALILRLRKEPNSAIYNKLLAQFKSGILDANVQQVLVSLLGEVGNYQAADTLMRLVNGALIHDPDVKLSAFHAISKFSPESWSEHPNTELAPVFETAWQTQQDTEFLPAIANVMASIGTSSTLDIFFKTLTDNNDEERVDIVKQAMTNLVNPALIPKLVEGLYQLPVENVQWASGDALANMGEIEAATAIFTWAAQADANQVDLVKEWVGTALNTTPEFVGYLETNLSTQVFAAPENKQAISSVVEDVKSGVE